MPSYKRDPRTNAWYVRWSETDPLTGKRSQPSKRPFRTREDAEEWYHRNIATRRASATAATPLRDYLERWLDIHGAGLSRNSHKTYRHAIDSITSYLGLVRLRDLTRSQIRDWHAALTRAGKAGGTVRTYHSVLSAALNQAVDDEILYQSPTHRAGPRVAKQAETPHWTADQIERFLDLTAADWAAMPYRIMVMSAIRPGECRALRWSAVNTTRATLTVPDAKTPAGIRTFRIPELLADDLRRWRPVQVERRLAAPYWDDPDLVVTSSQHPGRPMSATTMRRRLEVYCERLDLPRVTPHGLRHSWTSWMAVLGVHPSIVQQVLGHANIGITLNTYTHASSAMSAHAAAAVDEALGSERASTVQR